MTATSRSGGQGGSRSLLDDLMVEVHFYRAMHVLAIAAWKRKLTVEALVAMTDLVEPIAGEAEVPDGDWP